MTLATDLMAMYYAQNSKPKPIIYYPLNEVLTTLPTGQNVTITGSNYEPATYQGIQCMKFTQPGNTATWFDVETTLKLYREAWKGTASFWMAKQGFASDSREGFFFKVSGSAFNSYGSWFGVRKTSGGPFACVTYAATQSNAVGLIGRTDENFHNVVLLCECAYGWEKTSWSCSAYVDGVYAGQTSLASVQNSGMGHISIGTRTTNAATTGTAYYAGLRIYNKHLTQDEITELASEFTPTT